MEILFAEDDASMRNMVAAALRAAGHSVRLAANGSAALAELQDPPDLVILDYRMGSPDGLEVCRRIRADPRCEHLPVLILTAEGSVAQRVAGFEAGANDYLTKPFDVRELVARVNALFGFSRRDLERSPTSGLLGGTAIEREFTRRRTQQQPWAVCYLDLNDFKPFADRFGFALADAIIRDMGTILRSVSAESAAFSGHLGGDDFLLMCEPEAAQPLARRIQEHFHSRLLTYLPEEVAARGSYEAEDRSGVQREFPLTSVAVAILQIDAKPIPSLNQLGDYMAVLKQRAKRAESGIAEESLTALNR